MSKIEVTPEIVEQLKAIHKKLYKVTLSDQLFIYRPILRSEWNYLQDMMRSNSKLTAQDVDDQIVSMGLVWPEWTPELEFSELPAGTIPNLSLYIQAMSGFRTTLNVSLDEMFEVIQENGEKWGGPTEDQIKGYKKEFAIPMQKVVIGGQSFVLRSLRRNEWTAINRRGDSGDVELRILEKALVYPVGQDITEVTSAGVITTLSEMVLRLSGFGEEPTSTEEL